MLKRKLPAILIYFLLLFVSLGCYKGNSKDNALDSKQKKLIIDTCVSAFKTFYLYPDLVLEMEADINKRFKAGEYEGTTTLLGLTKQIKKDFRLISKDRHIWIDILENLPVKNSNVSDQEKKEELTKTNFGFIEFKVLKGNIGYLRLDGFVDVRFGKDTADAY